MEEGPISLSRYATRWTSMKISSGKPAKILPPRTKDDPGERQEPTPPQDSPLFIF